MHGKQAIIILISLKVMCLQTNTLVNILESENNFFYKINSQIHTLTNKLFSSLNLSHKFTRNSKVRALLNMHSDLNEIAEKYSSSYDYIKNVTSFTVIGNTTDLEKLFKEVIFYDDADGHQRNEVVNDTSTTLKNNDTFEFELESIVNKVLDKITKQSIQNIVLATNKFRRNTDSKAAAFRASREIKVWQPSISSENMSEENITRRIYKGKKTRIKKYPFLVSIHFKDEFNCAGSIISKDLVITAATCLQTAYNITDELRVNSANFFVRVGSDFTNRLGEMIPVIDIFFHPGFTPETLQNNIAIIKIMKRVKFSKKRKIQRIQSATDDINDGKSVTILGWGAKYTNKEIKETRRVSVAHLDIYNFNECTEVYTRYYVSDKNFCAGFVSKGGGACNKDVGGPAIVSGKLVGIISFGPLVCGMTDAPTVFTKVGSYIEWIDDIIRQKQTMRKAKPAKTLPEKPIRPFPMPVILSTTSNPIHPATVSSDSPQETTGRIYPDEIGILREILQEVVFTNNSIMDYILYGDEGDAVNTPTTTKRDQIKNKNKYLIERHYKQSRIKPVQRLTDKNNDNESSNYEDTDTGIKILESLVGSNTFKEKFTTSKRFHVTDSKKLKHQAFDRVFNSVEYAEGPDMNDGKPIPNDLSSYYEDEPGPCIENTKESISKENIFDERTTRSNKKRIQLEDYKNVIFSKNPLRESRGIITIDGELTYEGTVEIAGNKTLRNVNRERHSLETTTKKYIKHIQNMKLDEYKTVLFNLNPYTHKKQDQSDGKSKTANRDRKPIKQRIKPENNERAPVGTAMAISDDEFDYDMLFDKQEYENNIRSSYDREPVRWRYRSNA